MNRKTLYAFIVSFLLLIAVIVINRIVFREMKNYSKEVDHTRVVINYFERISNHFKSAQIYTPSFDTVRENGLLLAYKKDLESIPTELKELRQFVSDNPLQHRLVDSLSTLMQSQFGTLKKRSTSEIIQSQESWRLPYLLRIENMIGRGIKNERDLLAQRKAELERTTSLTNLLTTVFAVIAVALILYFFGATFFSTKRRRWLERFLASILDTSQNGIMHFVAIRKHGDVVDFRLDFANKASEELLGVKREVAVGRLLKASPAHILNESLLEAFYQTMQTGQSAVVETFYNKAPVERWLIVSLAKLENGITASFQDITQLKQYEEELKKNITELQRSNHELEQYAYVASHDLQEPLRKIRSFGSFLRESQMQKLDDKGKDQLKKMIASAERMSVLINDILSFSSAKKEETFKPTDLNEILQNTIVDLELLMAQKNAVIEYAELPVVQAIPLQMRQLFYNLINNALKFVREDRRPLIEISCRKVMGSERNDERLDSASEYYEIAFKDNGIGFNQEYAQQIFGMFKRLNDRRVYPGSGIGLALCKKVVENHDGIIYAEGSENQGATFFIYLPVK
jgi:PAS domain S-box-containing protein